MSSIFQAETSAKNGGKPHDFDSVALAAFLRRRHPHCTAGYVAAATGIAETTVKEWLAACPRCRPSTTHFLRLAGRYGFALITACWPAAPGEIKAAAQASTVAAIEGEMAVLRQRLAALEAERA